MPDLLVWLLVAFMAVAVAGAVVGALGMAALASGSRDDDDAGRGDEPPEMLRAALTCVTAGQKRALAAELLRQADHQDGIDGSEIW